MSDLIVLYASGGLGDFVKTWSWLRSSAPCVIVTSAERGKLAEAFLTEVTALDIMAWGPFFRGTGPPPKYVADFASLDVFMHDSFREHVWEKNGCIELLHAVAPDLKPPHFPRDFNEENCRGEKDEPKPNLHFMTNGLFHVGAGRIGCKHASPPDPYPIKDWDLQTSLAFRDYMAEQGQPVRLIAGSDQLEQWTPAECKKFLHNGGTICEGLFELACRVSAAKFFVGFDSGPTHLAAQLGKPTVVMFGPTGKFPVCDRPELKLSYCRPLGPLVKEIKLEKDDSNEQKVRLRWLTHNDAGNRVIATVEHWFKDILVEAAPQSAAPARRSTK